ncbi:protein MLP1-like [Chrysoperla carnea]|uniref:protein MLP1-like n=1 Tax=Chrysoperla carnea TaxID=189513 RepID=UPI001D08FAD5|nr:protein MLP1-like [Chrysoperla carnea]
MPDMNREKCDAYYRRKSLLQSDQIELPAQKEILKRHKEHLTSVLNEYIGKPIQLDIGVTPPLTGAKDDLWVSPSDLLIPHVRLKPPLTSKHVQALTHAGILGKSKQRIAIGREIQEKYQNEILDRFDVEMRLLADKLNFICHKEITKAVFEERLRGENELKMELNRVEHEYKSQLKEELNKLQSILLAEQEQKLEKQKQTLLEEARQSKKDAINDIANKLLNKFQHEFELQSQKHIKDVAQAIRIEEEKITKALENANADKLEALRILRHDLECRNMANLMYILTAERNRCENEKQKIYNEYKILIDEMISKALDLYKDILDLKSSSNKIKDKEWLLPPRFQTKMDTFNGDENKYAIKTLDEDSPLPSQQTLSSKTELNHLLYNKYVYVREDFRNRKAINLERNEYGLWLDASYNSGDKDDAISLGKRTYYPPSSQVHFHLKPTDEDEKNVSHSSSVRNAEGQQTFINPSKESDNSVRIEAKQPQSTRNGNNQNGKTQSTISRGSILRRASFKGSKKSIIGMITTAMNRKPSSALIEQADEDLDVPVRLSAVDMVSEHTNKHSSKLLVTKNSLVIHQRKNEPINVNESDETPGEIIENKDLLTKPLITTSVVSFLIAPVKDDLDSITTSKLSVARNSVELIRQKSATRSKTDVPSPKKKPTSSASSILFKMLPNDDVRLYKKPSPNNITEVRKIPSKKIRKSIGHDDEVPIEAIASKLTLATDSIELVKQKSKSATKVKSKATKGDIKSSILIAHNGSVNVNDQQSGQNPSLSTDAVNTNKYEDIVKNWSDANKIKNNDAQLSPLSKGKISRVAIIEEPVNIIYADSVSYSGAINPFNELDTMDLFSLNHLDAGDAQDFAPLSPPGIDGPVKHDK